MSTRGNSPQLQICGCVYLARWMQGFDGSPPTARDNDVNETSLWSVVPFPCLQRRGLAAGGLFVYGFHTLVRPSRRDMDAAYKLRAGINR